ncbi:2338_t:CDS:2 [Diversispora eburnea]|uniref:2338_t:CDS:1 n=1 Tax=Diversispora eburnea TaxID=1213867 RepID=A0A9N8V796_9GLOM|nr:2338_t:CDS:2 [Diversispora eburnea]
MKFKIFSIIGVLLCSFYVVTSSPIVPKEFFELEPRQEPVPYIFDPLPKLTDSSPTTRSYEFELRKENLSPDGFERTVWTVNGQYPGPLIQANKGDRIVFKVTNNFGEPATIHSHGIFQRGTNWYDGVPGQTQCPIPDKKSFTYNYTLTQSGTYWYHSHFLAQYVDGLVGPLIVHDSEDYYFNNCDEEYVLTISDWYHDPTSVLLPLRMAPGYTGLNPVPDSILISGAGQYNCSSPAAGSNCNSNVTPATYNVQKGKKYRFRIINTSAYAFFFFTIDNHSLKVIEVDGVSVKDTDSSIVNVLPIHCAQRYSVVVNCDQPIANYFIRAVIPDQCVPRPNNTINYNSSLTNGTGILHYDGADSNKPTSTPYSFDLPPCEDLNADAIRPYEDSKPPVDVTDEFVFNVTFAPDDKNVSTFRINNSSFVAVFNNPSNQRILETGGFSDFEVSQNAYGYDHSEGCVQIILLNSLRTDHPFHLHGHAFWLIASGPGIDPKNLSTFNLENPVIRDTAVVPPQGHLVIRYLADNPGVWAFHCHIEWHVELGMVAQLIERPTEFSKETLPDDVKELCVEYNNSVNKKRSTILPRNFMAKKLQMFRKVKSCSSEPDFLTTVVANKVCASALKAVILGAQPIIVIITIPSTLPNLYSTSNRGLKFNELFVSSNVKEPFFLANQDIEELKNQVETNNDIFNCIDFNKPKINISNDGDSNVWNEQYRSNVSDFISVKSNLYFGTSATSHDKIEKLIKLIVEKKNEIDEILLESQPTYIMGLDFQEDSSVPCISFGVTEKLEMTIMEKLEALFDDEFDVVSHVIPLPDEGIDKNNHSYKGNLKTGSGYFLESVKICVSPIESTPDEPLYRVKDNPFPDQSNNDIDISETSVVNKGIDGQINGEIGYKLGAQVKANYGKSNANNTTTTTKQWELIVDGCGRTGLSWKYNHIDNPNKNVNNRRNFAPGKHSCDWYILKAMCGFRITITQVLCCKLLQVVGIYQQNQS